MSATFPKSFGVAVLIPCYNEAAYIRQSIESVLVAASNVNLKINIIVSDNNSIDSSRGILSRLASENANLELIFQNKNIGARENWMMLLRRAKSDYIMFLDAHDSISSDYFNEVETELERMELSLQNKGTTFLPDEVMVFEGSISSINSLQNKYLFNDNPKIRFWQQLFYLNTATIVHALIPRTSIDIDFLERSSSYSFDQLLIHAYSANTSLYQMSVGKYFRLYKQIHDAGFTYRNSAGELESRAQRVQGNSAKIVTDNVLPAEIVEMSSQLIPESVIFIAKYLLKGKYVSRGTPYFCYRLARFIFGRLTPWRAQWHVKRAT